MARPDAVATGLYVPTPAHLIADMAALVRIDEPPAPVPPGSYDDQKTAIAVVDACCGEGSAVESLCAELDSRSARVSIRSYACELEETRAREAEGRLKWGQFRGGFECGDAFCLRAEPTPGAGVMLSNPPYHDEKGARGRLEVRFLRRTIGLLAPGGVLLLVVPHYSLADMVDPLAWELDHVRCFRFPDEDFGVYKQVLLVGEKRARLLRPDDLTERELRRWAADPTTCQPWDRIQTCVGAYAAPQTASHAKPFAQWEVAPLDLAALARATGPWRRTTRAGRPERIATVYPAQFGLALLRRRFPVVTPLKPAYVAAAIACGLFDGEVVRPDDPQPGRPDVLVRGVFARDFVAMDEKVSADGEVVGEVQVQRPRLEVTALDMTTGAYVALRSTAERTDGCSTIGDFLALYGRDLLAVMRRNCPVLHDPARDEPFPLPEPHAFPLFPAQADAVRAMVKLTHPRFAAERAAWLAGGLEVTHADRDPRRRNHIEVDEEDSRVSEVCDRHSGRRAQIRSADRGGSLIAGASGGYRTQTRNHRTVDRPPIPLFIGELGGGKTVQSLIFARAAGAKSALVLCPPHLVEKNWPAEVVKALGGHVRQTTLDSISAIDALATAAPVEFQVAILSREAAKLGHARASVTGACPACGAAVPPRDLAAKRERCEAPLPRRAAVDEDGRRDLAAPIVLDLARALLPVAPHKASVAQFVEGRAAERRYAAVVKRLARIGGGEATPEDEAWRTRCCEIARRACAEACVRVIGLKLVDPRAAFRLALASGSPALVWESLAEGLGKGRDGGWEATTHLRQAAAMLSLEQAIELEAWVESSAHELAPTAAVQRLAADNVCGYVTRDAGELRFDGKPLGDVEHAVVAIDLLLKAARWEPARLCGSPLWQAVPDPRRVPLADYIAARHPRLFDFFIRDEAHEHSENSSAQTGASEKLMRLIGRGVDLTGSACSGYAESLFTGTRVRDPRFREAFARGEEREFVRQYGFVKRIASDVDKETGKIVAYGSMSDRVERSYRVTGNAPGVLPLFLLDHLLRTSVPLHKADLGLALPPHTEHHVPVDLPDELAATFAELIKKTIAEIKRSRWKKGLAGKLWGALGELVSFPDVCTDDVTPGGVYEVRYPPGTVEGVEDGVLGEVGTIGGRRRGRTRKVLLEELGPGPLVCSAPTLSASTILPKERAMLEHVEAALRAGERVLVYPRHVELMPRLARLIERELVEPCPVLYASLPEGLGCEHGREERMVGDGGSGDRDRADAAGGSSPAPRGRRASAERASDRREGSQSAERSRESARIRVVGAGERQAWIESEVVNKGRRVLVVNPVAVKTGLNVLTWFTQVWWHENPNCDALTGRQANGRIDRIGKTRPTRSLYPTAGDLQEKAYRLWMHKVAVSLAVDGLDPGSALALAGLDGDADAMDGVSVGRQLLALLEKRDR